MRLWSWFIWYSKGYDISFWHVHTMQNSQKQALEFHGSSSPSRCNTRIGSYVQWISYLPFLHCYICSHKIEYSVPKKHLPEKRVKINGDTKLRLLPRKLFCHSSLVFLGKCTSTLSRGSIKRTTHFIWRLRGNDNKLCSYGGVGDYCHCLVLKLSTCCHPALALCI